VHLPPDAVRDPRPEPRRDPDGGHELGRADAEPDRERPVRRREGNEQLLDPGVDDAVEEERGAVQEDEDAGEDREEAVHVLDGKARPAELDPPGHRDAEEDRGR